MRALSGHSIALIWTIALLAAAPMYAPAQTNDLPRKPGEQSSETPSDKPPETAAPTNAAVRPPGEVANAEAGNPKEEAAQSSASQSDPVKQKVTADQAGQTPRPKPTGQNGAEDDSGALVIAPFPISSPAIGTGLQWILGYVLKLDKEDKISRPSFFGTAGMYTNNGSWGVLVGGSFSIKEDRYRILAATGYANVNFDFYGVGKIAGDRGLFLPINIQGKGFGIQPLFRIAKNLYLGPRIQYRQVNIRIDTGALADRRLPGIDILPGDIVAALRDDLQSVRTVALGPRLQRDTRNDTFYPTRGTILNATGDFFLEGLGSKFTYQKYELRFEGYHSLGQRQVLAYGSLGCAAAGDRVPIYDLCLFGFNSYLRGYSTGRFQDRRMWATQAEYRLQFPRFFGTSFTERFGAVAFGGVGWVGKGFDDMAFDDLLPSGGAGLRFRLTRKYPVNFRIDVGFGRTGHTVSMGVAEAF